MTAKTGRPFNAKELVSQIGQMNLFAISGGRVDISPNSDGEIISVNLPVSNGYWVTIELAWDDTYTVSRVFKRGAKVFNKGTVSDVYCDQVGEIAYQASCFRNVDFGGVKV